MIAVGNVGIVRSGLSSNVYNTHFALFLMNIRYTILIGIEQNTGIEVAIKFAPPGEKSDILTIEYENYLLLGAEGKNNKNNIILVVIFNQKKKTNFRP